MTDAQRMMAEAERTGATLRVKAWRGAADPHAALLGYVSAGPWALRPDVLEQFTAILNRHLNGGQADLAAVQALLAAKAAADPDMPADWAEADPDGLRIAQGVAVLPVSGLIAKHARLVNGVSQPRGTSIEALRGQFDRAMASDKVRAILLHIESPGGYLAGVPDFADDLREADKTKPILAFADDDACSAAYWLGSQAGVFLANQNADVGSIGVYMVLVDSSRAAENEGIRVIPVASGPHKATGLAGTPISEERLAPLRRNVQASYEMFLAAVLAGRGARGPDEAALRAVADGRFFLAAEARDLRLIDDVVPLAEALRRAARAGKQLTSVSARAATDPRKRSKTMPDSDRQDEVALDAARAEASKAFTQRLKDLQAAFPADPARAMNAASRDLSVTEAKAEAYDHLLETSAAALAARDEAATAVAEENAKLKKLLGSRGLSAKDIEAFDPSDVQIAEPEKPAAADGPDDGKAETYQAAIDAAVKAGKTRTAAHAEAASRLPKAFGAWTQAQQPVATAHP